MKLRQILKRSLGVRFDFDGSKFVSSSDRLFVKYFIHKRSRCEFIQLRKRQRGVFQNHGVCGQAFPLLASPPPPLSFHQCCARPNFRAAKKRNLKRAEKPMETLATQATVCASFDGLSKIEHYTVYRHSDTTTKASNKICDLGG